MSYCDQDLLNYEYMLKVNSLNEFFDLSLKNKKLDKKTKNIYQQLQKLMNNTPNEKFNLIGMNEILKNEYNDILKGVINE